MIILIGLIVVKKVYDFLIPYYRKLSFKTKKIYRSKAKERESSETRNERFI